ncbi:MULTISPECIES: hypothetical protein [unclassified Rhizobium]|nr:MULTISPECIES: hypothetical protein [unclassified Rhizobium]
MIRSLFLDVIASIAVKAREHPSGAHVLGRPAELAHMPYYVIIIMMRL